MNFRKVDLIFGVDDGYKFSVLFDYFLEGGVFVYYIVEYIIKGLDIRFYIDLKCIIK